MNLANKIIKLIFIRAITVLPTVSASHERGKGIARCAIAPFSFGTGITPVRFHDPANIDMAAGWCDFLQIVSNVIGLLYMIIIPIATLVIIVGGAFLITAGGNEGQIKKGKAFLKSAIIGLIIALGAGIIIGAIIRGLGVVEEATLMPWFFN